QLNFAFEGETSQTVSVPVRGDTRVEEDETFFLDVHDVVGAQIGKASGVATITNDDDLSVLRLLPGGDAPESRGFTEVTVERLAPSGDASRVTVATAGGTAEPGVDFTPVTEVVSWAAGEGGRKVVRIPLIDDRLPRGDRTLEVELRAPVEAV